MMKNIIEISRRSISALLSAAAIITGCPDISAVPAKPGLMEITCRDGMRLNVRLMGDEYHHYYLTEDNFPLIREGECFYLAGIGADGLLVRTDIKATPPTLRDEKTRRFLADLDMTAVKRAIDISSAESPRRLSLQHRNRGRRVSPTGSLDSDEGFAPGPGLFPGTSFPSRGDQKAIVILVEYSDVKFQTDNPLDYFKRMLNEDGFDDYEGTGCAAEYFRECSDGRFRPVFDVYGPVTLRNKRSYYGGNDWSGNDRNPEKMVIEACQELDSSIDFSDYDRDGDGYIDNVFVFYAGQGEASGGPSESVWPHSWEMSATGQQLTFDGVVLDRYACSNEWENGRPDGIGTFVHEFSHVMGLPDLYATSYTSAFTPGAWSVLDYGPYNNGGRTPPLYGAFERYALGWMSPAEISGNMNATLPAIGSNVAGVIRTDSPNEFFLLENRQQTGWDRYIPGHGMLVWHVDYNDYQWNANTVNNSASHQYVDIEEADNIRNEATRDGDTFPGASGITAFTDTTSPSMLTWQRKPLGMPITDIAECSDGLITFKVLGGGDDIKPAEALAPDSISDDMFIARWEAEECMEYLLTVYEIDASTGERTILRGYDNLNAGHSDRIPVTGLEIEHEYSYRVRAMRGLEISDPSEEITVITGKATLRRFAVEALDASDIDDAGFTACWRQLELASDYLLSVYTKEYTPVSVSEGFDSGFDNLPDGWSSSSKSGYYNEPYSASAMPSLRLGNTGDYLKITYPDGISGLSFWHRGNATASDDLIRIHATCTDGSRHTIMQTPVVKTAGGRLTETDDFPDNTISIEIEFIKTAKKGALAIDDVTVRHGSEITEQPVKGYATTAVGNVSYHKVTGLRPDTEYFYTVTASDGTLFSRKSAEIEVRTSSETGGVGYSEAGSTGIIVDGRRVRVTGKGTVAITDITGRVIASGKDNLDIRLSTPGIYIITTDGISKKIMIQ